MSSQYLGKLCMEMLRGLTFQMFEKIDCSWIELYFEAIIAFFKQINHRNNKKRRADKS